MKRQGEPPLAPTRVRMKINNCTKKIKWSKEEDKLLYQLLQDNDNPNWPFVAKNFPNKSAQQVSERWEKVLNPKLVKGSWTRDEDETIINYVQKNGAKNWTELAKLLPGRIGKQCRERWKNHLDPSINHSMWTNDEDFTLIKLHERFGNSWVKIAQMMPGRSDNAIKNRWNSTLKKMDSQNQVQYGASHQIINQFPQPIQYSNVPKINILPNVALAANLLHNIPCIDQRNQANQFSNFGNIENSNKMLQNSVVKVDESSQNAENPMISFVSSFSTLLSPLSQKISSSESLKSSPRAITAESNRKQFIVLLDREDDKDQGEP